MVYFSGCSILLSSRSYKNRLKRIWKGIGWRHSSICFRCTHTNLILFTSSKLTQNPSSQTHPNHPPLSSLPAPLGWALVNLCSQVERCMPWVMHCLWEGMCCCIRYGCWNWRDSKDAEDIYRVVHTDTWELTSDLYHVEETQYLYLTQPPCGPKMETVPLGLTSSTLSERFEKVVHAVDHCDNWLVIVLWQFLWACQHP